MRKKKMMSLGLLGAACVVMSGCTYPTYGRTVTRSYDANGKFTGSVVTEEVSQMNPHSKPLMSVLDQQTYRK